MVVVNLNRAKVEEVELDPPQEKKHSSSGAPSCSGANTREHGVLSSTVNNHHHNELSTASLNTNPHWSSSATHTPTPPIPIRSIIPAGIPTPDSEGGSPAAHLGKNMTAPSSQTDLLIHEASPSLPPPTTNRRRARETIDSAPSSSSSIVPSTVLPPSLSPPLLHTPACLASARPTKKAVRRSGKSTSISSSKSSSNGGSSNKLHLSHSEWEELRRLREIPSSQNGVSMKRKAVMEAIGEILKKMYAQRVKGKVPGTFKGRFSSEFTCDSDMQEIIHSKTTMTSYGEMMGATSGHDHHRMPGQEFEQSALSKARFKENEQLKDKMAMLKWKLHQQKVMRKLKRERSEGSSPCSESGSWTMDDIDCDLNTPPPKLRKKMGFCGLKRGFLLAD